MLGLVAATRDKGDPVISLGAGHGIARSHLREGSRRAGVVYTRSAVFVETAAGPACGGR
jgi:hypothetical protein